MSKSFAVLVFVGLCASVGGCMRSSSYSGLAGMPYDFFATTCEFDTCLSCAALLQGTSPLHAASHGDQSLPTATGVGGAPPGTLRGQHAQNPSGSSKLVRELTAS